ncbi:methyl-accepting chemotaxis protein [Motiliproteus sp. MSK22-1]|uniref:methyl-accepting chemotaxis protein n=1 Tax=Motiliproteus sp. MSK22-1 TaxID=1897630 RepID=UPI00097628F2|nr:methyl-accepting chemotaxis protein [Motiliproteus sp. MSK22-1]OMH33574.1 hypothetical protein BGP75_11125 [Motiliproteus sp. MSK22-1]
MKVNTPVTDKEVVLQANQEIVSKTDLKGLITYVNQEFVDISGFTEHELIGKNHNIVRHPDMPPEAFADLWATLLAGEPWAGMVKNRCKNGDFYWVKANVTPVRENGRIIEFMSVRSKPGAGEIAAADTLYQNIKEKKSSLAQPGYIKKLNLRQKLNGFVISIGVVLALLGAFLFSGLDSVERNWKDYQNQVVKRQQLLAEVKSQFGYGGVVHNFKNYVLRASEVYYQRTEQNFVSLNDMLVRYRALHQGDAQERGALAAIENVIGKYRQALKNSKSLVSQGLSSSEVDAAVKIDDSPAFEAFEMLEKKNRGLSVSSGEALSITIDNSSWGLLAGGICFFIFVGGFLSITFRNVILKPINELVFLMGQTAEGKYNAEVDLSRRDELGQLFRAVKSMQIKLGFDISDSRSQTREALRVKEALDNVSSNVMMADTSGRIIYMNKAVMGMMTRVEENIRADLPEFEAGKLLGSNIDQFHKNPEYQRELLKELSTSYEGKISIGGSHFSLTASPVVDGNGNRLGTAVEWQDITEQLDAERQVEALIKKAVVGELDDRLNSTAYSGFMKNIANGVNQMLDTMIVPIREVCRVLTAMAEGDLTATMEGQFQGEFAQLNDALNSTLQKLRGTTGSIIESGNRISLGASEIAQGNATLRQRTEQQAANLDETASSMEQMTSTVKQNAENAREADILASKARDQAETGGEVVGHAVGAMATINESSKRISEIIGVIDEIAFQTNLLALNAAVEAARAGEQGRGFAVVASEVRKLAQRSASAAKDIKDLISDSVDKVSEGTRLVNESGQALTDIVQSVIKVSDIVASIAEASREQSSGIEQVNQAISQMDEVTQQNAALVEQTAAGSEVMSSQSQQMVEMIAFFKIHEEAELNQRSSRSAG